MITELSLQCIQITPVDMNIYKHTPCELVTSVMDATIINS